MRTFFFPRFRIYDGKDTGKELTPARGLYGKYSKGNYEFSSGNIQDYISSGQELTLYFIGSPSEDFRGFELLLTVFKGNCVHTQERHCIESLFKYTK